MIQATLALVLAPHQVLLATLIAEEFAVDGFSLVQRPITRLILRCKTFDLACVFSQ